MTPAIYLYAVVRVVPTAADQRAPQLEDYAPAPFQRVAYRDLIAIVEPLPLGAGAFTSGNGMMEPQWIRARLLKQEQLYATLAGHYVVLPAEFGTILAGRAGVIDFLDVQYAALSAALDQITGSAEWGVRVFYEPGSLQTLNAPHARTKTAPNVGRSQRTEVFCAQDATSCHLQLLASARSATIHPLVDKNDGRRTVLNAAYLVDRDAQDNFSAALSALEQQYALYHLRFEITGPWPPALRATAHCGAELMLEG